MAKGGLAALLGKGGDGDEKPKKSKGLALLLSPKGGDDDSEDTDELVPDKSDLAGSVMDAMRSDDKEALADALEAFVGACEGDY